MKLAKRSPSAFSDKSQVKFEKPPNFVARRTEIWDASAIRNLSNSRVKDLFGHVVVENLIERNLFGVTLLDEEDEIVAHGSFTHYPNHQQKFSRAYDSAEWEPFLRAHFEHHPQQGGARSKQQYQDQKRSSVSGSVSSMAGRAADESGPRIDVNMATALNSMFLHLFVSRPELEAAALREAIHTLFAAVPDVHFLFLIVPIEANLPNHYRDLLIQMDLQSSVKRAPEFNLFATTRDFFVPKLFIRPAKYFT